MWHSIWYPMWYEKLYTGKSKHPLKTKTKGFRSKSSIRIQESGLEAASCEDVKSASRQSYGRSALPFSRACTPKTQKPLSFASVPFHSSSLRLSRHPPRRQPSRSPLPPPPPWASSRTGSPLSSLNPFHYLDPLYPAAPLVLFLSSLCEVCCLQRCSFGWFLACFFSFNLWLGLGRRPWRRGITSIRGGPRGSTRITVRSPSRLFHFPSF